MFFFSKDFYLGNTILKFYSKKLQQNKSNRGGNKIVKNNKKKSAAPGPQKYTYKDTLFPFPDDLKYFL